MLVYSFLISYKLDESRDRLEVFIIVERLVGIELEEHDSDRPYVIRAAVLEDLCVLSVVFSLVLKNVKELAPELYTASDHVLDFFVFFAVELSLGGIIDNIRSCYAFKIVDEA